MMWSDQDHNTRGHWEQMILSVKYQLLLVPEALLLAVLLGFHFVLDAPLLTALFGVVTIGWFLVRSGLIEAARWALDKANYDHATHLIRWGLRLYPYSADAQAIWGMVCIAQDHIKEAEVALRRAIYLYPGCATLHVALSGIFLEAEQPEAAHREATRALKLDPEQASAYLHLAYAEQQIGASHDTVETLLRRGLRCEPVPADEAALRCTLAALLIVQDRPSEAQLALAGVEVLLARCPAPQQAGLHYYLGEVRRAIGDAETAHSHFSASEILDPHGRYAADAWRAARSHINL